MNCKSMPRNERSCCYSPQLLLEHCCPRFLSSTEMLLTLDRSLVLQMGVILMIAFNPVTLQEVRLIFPWTDKSRQDLDHSTNSKIKPNVEAWWVTLCHSGVKKNKKTTLSVLSSLKKKTIRAHCEAEQHDPEHFSDRVRLFSVQHRSFKLESNHGH